MLSSVTKKKTKENNVGDANKCIYFQSPFGELQNEAEGPELLQDKESRKRKRQKISDWRGPHSHPCLTLSWPGFEVLADSVDCMSGQTEHLQDGKVI